MFGIGDVGFFIYFSKRGLLFYMRVCSVLFIFCMWCFKVITLDWKVKICNILGKVFNIVFWFILSRIIISEFLYFFYCYIKIFSYVFCNEWLCMMYWVKILYWVIIDNKYMFFDYNWFFCSVFFFISFYGGMVEYYSDVKVSFVDIKILGLYFVLFFVGIIFWIIMDVNNMIKLKIF